MSTFQTASCDRALTEVTELGAQYTAAARYEKNAADEWTNVINVWRKATKTGKKRMQAELEYAFYVLRGATYVRIDRQAKYENAILGYQRQCAALARTLGQRIPDEFANTGENSL